MPIQQIKNLMHQVQSNPNPQVALQHLIMQNPTLQNLYRMSGGNWKQVAQNLAQQRGVDLNALIQELQS